MNTFEQYRRKQIAELRPYVEGESMAAISISSEDIKAGSPKLGDMIARNPKNHADQWLVAAQYFADNFEPVAAPPPPRGEEALREALVKIVEWLEARLSEYPGMAALPDSLLGLMSILDAAGISFSYPFDAALAVLPAHSQPSVNAELLDALKGASERLEHYVDEFGDVDIDRANLNDWDELVARAEASPSLSPTQDRETVIEPLEALVSIVEEECCGPSTEDDSDDESVGWSADGPLPMTFGHIRRARAALRALKGEAA